MPTLDWIGKKAVVKHHKEVPYRLLDRKVGNLWAEMSGGQCRFVMVKDRNWAAIDALL